MAGRAVARTLVLLVLCLGHLLSACGDETAQSPFAGDDDGGAAGEGAGLGGASDAPVDPTLGGPCNDADHCDDEIDCTVDRCDLDIERCRFEPDAGVCADDVYCDGEEQCVPGLGCREGEPVSCSDGDSCTIDRCVEATRSCEREPRDADGDGDPVWNCDGGDCDDTDPKVSSEAMERCGNQKDDDCDGETDEDDCVAPEHDTCADALEITGSGNHVVSLAGAGTEYPLSCQSASVDYRDVVLAVIVPEPDAMDVDIVAETSGARLVLGGAGQCGDASSEIACVQSHLIGSTGVARMRLRALEPGAYPVYVTGDGEKDVAVSVRFEEPTDPPENETCGTAQALLPDEHAFVSLSAAVPDVSSACNPELGDLFYSFELDEPSDVTLRAVPLDDYGSPVLSLRSDDCVEFNDEITCRSSAPAELYERALPAGVYTVAVSATGPTDIDLVLSVDEPSPKPPGEGCSGAPALEEGGTNISFDGRIDAVQMGCLVGAPDASFSLDLAAASDVLLVGRLSDDDVGALLIAEPPCTSETHEVVCDASQNSPLRVSAHGLPKGSYRVVAESSLGNPIALDTLVRPALPTTYVAFADECESALTIPETGGRFEGNTSGQYADYDAGCDYGGGTLGGAPDQMLRLELSSERRVILDMRGSDFATLLAVRRGPGCPGEEVTLGCSSGSSQQRSFLDLTLPAGDYFVQVDGYDEASGHWLLDVFIEPP